MKLSSFNAVCVRTLLSFTVVAVSTGNASDVDPAIVESLQTALADLQSDVDSLRLRPEVRTRDGRAAFADVAIFTKSVKWMLHHHEFPKPGYAKQAAMAIAVGKSRARELDAGMPGWLLKSGTTIRGYVSRVDGSVQPYALTLPEDVNPLSGKRWPLHVKLHGRANDMNEVNFISRHEGRKLPSGQDWIQLDVYGRGNNAYRWAGETDVFEALEDVRRRFRIDDDRITLHGFSMGGAGAWHLGLHHPSTWSSVGPGAGFVDFYKYQNQTQQLPAWQHATLGIYDAIDYALNASNVPVCTYGGENDAQLVASTSMMEAAKTLDVDMKLLIGPGMGHKFHPDSFQEFMEFHKQKSADGRKHGLQRRNIRFSTRSLRYNKCDWLTIQEVETIYQPSTVEASLDDSGNVVVFTDNVSALTLFRDVATTAVIDGVALPCYNAAEGLLPDVYYVKSSDGWDVLDYNASRRFPENPDGNKRHRLQGPIDDAFMDSFVCVIGTETAASDQHQAWVDWTLDRFRNEYHKWMRSELRVVRDVDLTDDTVRDSHLILFGDPQSNSVMRSVMPRLPVDFDGNAITVGDQTWDASRHGLSLIFPNPLNPRKYVVINSGHTFHEKDFQNSNSWLFPRLGDIAVQKFSQRNEGFDESIVWAANFNSGWQLSTK